MTPIEKVIVVNASRMRSRFFDGVLYVVGVLAVAFAVVVALCYVRPVEVANFRLLVVASEHLCKDHSGVKSVALLQKAGQYVVRCADGMEHPRITIQSRALGG